MAEKNISVRLSARVDAYVAAMKAAERSTTGFSRATQRNLKQVGGQMQNVGRRMTTMVSLPIVAAGALAVKAAVDWESAWAGVTKTVDGTAEQMADLEQGLRDMTKELPASHAEIAAVAEAAGQLGIGVEDVEDFTRVMIDLGETTNLSAGDAATALARFMNIMGTAQSDVDRVGSTVVDLGNNFASTEAEIVEFGLRLAAAGRQAGLSETDVLAFGTALSSVGVRAEAGGTAFSKVFRTINDAVLTGGERLETFAQVAGMSAEQFRAAYEDDAALAIASFVAGLGDIAKTGGSTTEVLAALGLSNERVQAALLGAGQAGDLLVDALGRGETAWRDNTALTDEAAKRYGTAAARFEMVRNKIVDLFIDLGEMILPVVETVVDALGGLAGAFQDLPAPLQGAILGFLGLVAAAGPVIFMAGTLVRNFTAIRSAMALMGGAAGRVKQAFGLLGVAAILGVGAYTLFTAEGRRVKENTDAASDALGRQFFATLAAAEGAAGAASEINALAVANEALSLSIAEGNEELAAAAAVFNISGQELLDVLALMESDSVELTTTIDFLGRRFGLTAEQASWFALQLEGVGLDMTQDQFRALAAEMGITNEQFDALVPAINRFIAAADDQDIDQIAQNFLDTRVAALGYEDSLVALAEANTGLNRAIEGEALPVYREWARLVAESTPEQREAAGITEELANEIAAVGPEAWVAAQGMEELTGATEEMEGVAASSIDTLTLQQEALEAVKREVDFFADALDTALGGAREWVRAHDGFALSLLELDDAIDDGTTSLDANTEAGLKNRSAVFDLADDLLRLTESNIKAGRSQDEVNAEYLAGREALLDAAEAAGLNRDEVNELINEYGLVPELVSTSIQLKNTALQQWRIQQYLDDLNEIPKELATQITAAIDSGDLDRAEYLLNQWKYRQDLTLRYKITISNPNISISSSTGGGGRLNTHIQAIASARGRYVDRPMLSTLGEGGRPEAVLPLTNMSRMRELLSDARIGGPVSRAMEGNTTVNSGVTYSFGDVIVGSREDAGPMVDALGEAMFLARHGN